jgi:3',5'-nucleoside bisphosphate phosphatase
VLLSCAAAAGLSAVAVTDHDTVAGVAAASAAGAARGVTVVAGVELSASDEKGAEVHMLGLHLVDLARIAAPLARFQADRVTRAIAIVAALNRGGVPVTIEAVMAEAGPGAVGRPHVARALIAGGWARDLREAFDRWLGADKPAFVEKPRLEIADAIRLIHDAGGVAIWAHPGREGTRTKIENMVAQGLDGVEVTHPGHSMDDMNRLNALARHRDLLRSGGSDWHGATDGPRSLGAMRVPAEWNDAQAERATRYRPTADTWRSPVESRS